MKFKVIGIGNRIMMDESIGVRLAEELTDWLEENGVEVIIRDSDSQSCLNGIKEEDFLIVIDATLYDLVPGTITLQDLTRMKPVYKGGSPHNMCFKNKGFFIGIEAGEIGFGAELSEELKHKRHLILDKLRNVIDDILVVCKNS